MGQEHVDHTAEELRLDTESLQAKLDDERIALIFRVRATETGLQTGGGAIDSFQKFLRDHPDYQVRLIEQFTKFVMLMAEDPNASTNSPRSVE